MAGVEDYLASLSGDDLEEALAVANRKRARFEAKAEAEEARIEYLTAAKARATRPLEPLPKLSPTVVTFSKLFDSFGIEYTYAAVRPPDKDRWYITGKGVGVADGLTWDRLMEFVEDKNILTHPFTRFRYYVTTDRAGELSVSELRNRLSGALGIKPGQLNMDFDTIIERVKELASRPMSSSEANVRRAVTATERDSSKATMGYEADPGNPYINTGAYDEYGNGY